MRITILTTTLLSSWIMSVLIPSVYAQAEASTYPWMEFVTAEKIFSLAFILAFIGAGRFVDNKAWPWFTEFMETRQRYDHEREQEREALTRDILQTMSNVSFSLGKVISLMEQIAKEIANDKDTKA